MNGQDFTRKIRIDTSKVKPFDPRYNSAGEFIPYWARTRCTFPNCPLIAKFSEGGYYHCEYHVTTCPEGEQVVPPDSL